MPRRAAPEAVAPSACPPTREPALRPSLLASPRLRGLARRLPVHPPPPMSDPAGLPPETHSASPIARYLKALHDKYARLEDGAVATYIPPLGKANPAWFGIAIATVDGEVYEVGDSRIPFTIQSISKPLVYGLALEVAGLKTVLTKVGVEPSGEAFNSISLDPRTGRPLNPMINAGAIATTSLLPGPSARERLEFVLARFSEFAGRPLGIDEEVYRSERDTGHRNRAIAHLLRNSEILGGDPEEPLDLYFRQCSISVHCRDLAIIAATLAAGGVNPLSRQRVLGPLHAGRLLSIMSSCGMYDFAGEWIYNIGMPAKSGVSGGILAVLPGQLGVGIFSPPLDARGNSVRGIRVCTDLSLDFGLHLFNTPRILTPVLRGVHSAAVRRSKRLRLAGELEILAREGHRVRVYELGGRLLFASVEQAIRTILEDVADASHVILDLSRVIDIDHAACRLLLDLHEQLLRQRRRISLAGLQSHTALRNYVTARLTEDGWRELCRHGTPDEALETFENELLQTFHAPASSGPPPSLAQQELCAGFTPDEIAALNARVTVVELPSGTVALAAGSQADSMYFLLEGEVGIFVADAASPPETGPAHPTSAPATPAPSAATGPRSQLISRLGPGMSFGEIALADRAPRSATVRTLTAIRALELPFGAFDRLPADGLAALQTKLFANLARVLARRLRAANAELRSLK